MKIPKLLQNFNSIFYTFFVLGEPHLDTYCETACIVHDTETDITTWHFNKDWWPKLNDYMQTFVIAHECLHQILEHPLRGSQFENKLVANFAADIIVNDMLIETYGFDKSRIEDGLFSSTFKLPSGKSFEYYYQKLMEKTSKEVKGKGNETLDSHVTWGESGEVTTQEIAEQIANSPDLTTEEKKECLEELNKIENMISSKQAGKSAGGGYIKLLEKFHPKKRWISIIKKWNRSSLSEKEGESWVKEERRFQHLNHHRLLLPGKEAKRDKNKISIVLYLDTSGSCLNFAKVFYQVALSIPRSHFDVKMYGFSTDVYEIIDGKLLGFGGTSFSIIEHHLSFMPKYPKAVFIVTDGYGNKVSPAFPERWHWFLTEEHTLSYIPSKSKVFNVKDFADFA